MNIRKLKKRWHKILPNTKKISKRLLHFYVQDKKLAQKYLEGKIMLYEYLYQRENIKQKSTTIYSGGVNAEKDKENGYVIFKKTKDYGRETALFQERQRAL